MEDDNGEPNVNELIKTNLRFMGWCEIELEWREGKKDIIFLLSSAILF